jgi:hypothetical protein
VRSPIVALYDVSVLLALFDPHHTKHDAVFRWHREQGKHGWASCPITENGLVRIMSQPKYPNPQTLSDMIRIVRNFVNDVTYQFWSDDFSVGAPDIVDTNTSLTSSMLTDIYLLALAMKNDGRLVTLDSRIPARAVIGAKPEHLVVL